MATATVTPLWKLLPLRPGRPWHPRCQRRRQPRLVRRRVPRPLWRNLPPLQRRERPAPAAPPRASANPFKRIRFPFAAGAIYFGGMSFLFRGIIPAVYTPTDGEG